MTKPIHPEFERGFDAGAKAERERVDSLIVGRIENLKAAQIEPGAPIGEIHAALFHLGALRAICTPEPTGERCRESWGGDGTPTCSLPLGHAGVHCDEDACADWNDRPYLECLQADLSPTTETPEDGLGSMMGLEPEDKS